MEVFWVLALLGFLGIFIIGGVCGIVAVVRVNRLTDQVRALERKLQGLINLGRQGPVPLAEPASEPGPVRKEMAPGPPKQTFPQTEPMVATVPLKGDGQTPSKPEPLPEPEAETRPAPSREPRPEIEPPATVQALPPPPNDAPLHRLPGPPPPDRTSGPGLEAVLGTKWLGWAGIVMLVMGVGYLLKYAYDNDLIGPTGRLAIGLLFGIAALATGHLLKKRGYSVMFQTLTGGGIAIFYTCIYFSFQVYGLIEPMPAMVLSIFVTLGAVVLAVAHNAPVIAMVGLIGGFLSPVLFSTGENHPYLLFNYVIALDLVALGVAYFRKWHAVQGLAFVGTLLLYLGWYGRYYDESQMTPALLYLSVFYAIFLLIPIFHALARRSQTTAPGLVLMSVNALFSLLAYADILYDQYRPILGFVVLGQAVLVFVLFLVWVRRRGKAEAMGESLLILALALVTLAVPIQLRVYGIAVAWAVEGVLFTFLGLRFNKMSCRVGGTGALLLAGMALLTQLPLHELPFVPVFNIGFGSWSLVIAAAAIIAYRLKTRGGEKPMAVLAAAAGFGLLCLLLSLEASHYWDFSDSEWAHNYRLDTLVALWAVIPTAVVLANRRWGRPTWHWLAWLCFAVGFLFFIAGMETYAHPSTWLVLNPTCFSKLVFAVALFLCARILAEAGGRSSERLEFFGQVLVLWLIGAEWTRWSDFNDMISARMGNVLISASWAAQALILIWVGLITRRGFRRYTGLGIFVLAAGKTVLFDITETVYQIVSFMVIGVLALGAAYFYQRFGDRIFDNAKEEKVEPTEPDPH